MVVEREAIPGLPHRRRVGTHEFEVGVHQIDALTLESRPALGDDERGGHAQLLLQQRDYPVYLRSPLKDIVVFDSHDGTQYSCNPRAIYEELARRNPDLECVWVTQDGQFSIDFATDVKTRTVLAGSREHYRVLARARHIITNHGLPPWFFKRDGQTYVQTWHGSPLKRLAHDLRDMPYQRTERHDWMQWRCRDGICWCPRVRTPPRSCAGRSATTGTSWRPDIRATTSSALPNGRASGTRVRKRLGIPDGKKVVLYAPTWRDDRRHGPGKQGFSLDLDVETVRRTLGDDHVLLLRTHHLVTDKPRSTADDFVMDVSRYPDIAELYMAADVLVTDYSSAMFDYAVLGRPIILYTPDLERYRDHVRGFYLDLVAEAPGPVVSTSAALAKAVKAAPDSEDRYADAYDRFFVKYCPTTTATPRPGSSTACSNDASAGATGSGEQPHARAPGHHRQAPLQRGRQPQRLIGERMQWRQVLAARRPVPQPAQERTEQHAPAPHRLQHQPGALDQLGERAAGVTADAAERHVVRRPQRHVARHGQQRDPARTQHPGDLRRRPRVVLDVLQDVQRQREVVLARRERQERASPSYASTPCARQRHGGRAQIDAGRPPTVLGQHPAVRTGRGADVDGRPRHAEPQQLRGQDLPPLAVPPVVVLDPRDPLKLDGFHGTSRRHRRRPVPPSPPSTGGSLTPV